MATVYDLECWEVLGLAPVRDKSAIKKAYAKQLKHTRPDEDADGFQRLHAAYHSCLSALQYDGYWESLDQLHDAYSSEVLPESDVFEDGQTQAHKASCGLHTASLGESCQHVTQTNERVFTAQHKEAEQHASNDCDNQQSEHDNEQPDCESRHKQQRDCENRVYALLSCYEKLHDPAQLNACLADDALYDIEFKQHISDIMIEGILTLYAAQIPASKTPLRKPVSFPVLQRLGEFFGWHASQFNIEARFAYHACVDMFLDDLCADAPFFSQFDYVQQLSAYNKPFAHNAAFQATFDTTFGSYIHPQSAHESPEYDYTVIKKSPSVAVTQSIASFEKRAAAGVLDTLLYVICVLPLLFMATHKLGLHAYKELVLFGSVMLYVQGMVYLQTSSKAQATIGQRAFGMCLVGDNNQPVPSFVAFFRLILASISAIVVVLSFLSIIMIPLLGLYFLKKYQEQNWYTFIDALTNTRVVRVAD